LRKPTTSRALGAEEAVQETELEGKCFAIAIVSIFAPTPGPNRKCTPQPANCVPEKRLPISGNRAKKKHSKAFRAVFDKKKTDQTSERKLHAYPEI
jgi:hypothetical protein